MKSLSFLPERGAPRFCHTLQCFGAIFQVWPSPESMKIVKKCLRKLVVFLVACTTHPGPTFCDLGVHLGCLFRASEGTFRGN